MVWHLELYSAISGQALQAHTSPAQSWRPWRKAACRELCKPFKNTARRHPSWKTYVGEVPEW